MQTFRVSFKETGYLAFHFVEEEKKRLVFRAFRLSPYYAYNPSVYYNRVVSNVKFLIYSGSPYQFVFEGDSNGLYKITFEPDAYRSNDREVEAIAGEYFEHT